MASVKNKNTKPEIRVRKALFTRGFRYKINDKSLPGSPDIVLPKYRVAIMIHGCYWHGHSKCFKAIKPKTNFEFWNDKIRKNKIRDETVKQQLHGMGWHVIEIFECELRNKKSFKNTIDRLEGMITGCSL